jgi:hypothetical protein
VSSLELLEQATGEQARPDLAARFRLLSEQELADLVERVLEQPLRPSTTPAENEVWPLIGARTSTFTAGGSNEGFVGTAGAAGINLFAAVDPRSAGTGRFSNSLLRALLYSHGLTVEDPFALAAHMYIGTSSALRQTARLLVEAAVDSICEIAPLLRRGVVQTFYGRDSDETAVSVAALIGSAIKRGESGFDDESVWRTFEEEYVSQLSPGLQETWRQIRSGNPDPPIEPIEEAARADVEVVETFVEVVTSIRPQAIIDNAIGVVAETVADSKALGGRFDILCPTRLYAQLMFVGEPDPVHSLRVRELARVEIPTIENLLVEDVISIRQTSEAFALWRARLSLGLERAQRLREEAGGRIDSYAAVAEVLADARSVLFDEFARSSTLRSRVARPIEFVAGALGGAAGGAAGGVAGAAIGATAATLPPIIAHVVAGRDAVPAFLRRHYMLFELGAGER